MAERCDGALAAKLAAHLDRSRDHLLIAFDEGADEGERIPLALADRLAFYIEPEGRMPSDWPSVPAGTEAPTPAQVEAAPEVLETLTMIAARFGIHSLRAPLLALRTARSLAALDGRRKVGDDDIRAAAELVYPHRATIVPAEEEPQDDAPPPEAEQDSMADDGNDRQSLPDGDLLIEAVKALLPPGLLNGLIPAGTTRRAGGSGAGQKRKGNRKGRPLPSRPGRLDGRSRIDLVATLRAAAPWQPLRRQTQPDAKGLLIRPDDIRLKRYQEQSDRLLIFAVDASGSAALSRLNEAKGAVEMLLAEAYAQRDHVALISFRGSAAEVLLPPTRSLVQTKRRLAALPGGGGTPLASGLQQASLLAKQSLGRGLTPTVVLITDGRANIALDGSADRATAAADAERVADDLRRQGTAALVIDMSTRPQDALKALAGRLHAPYLALPRADAKRLSTAVSAALDG
jgi:magnesium chelatase subunit D